MDITINSEVYWSAEKLFIFVILCATCISFPGS